ncbi:MAG: hypothetical protein Kow00133_05150 [Amphiplicatus sp.]
MRFGNRTASGLIAWGLLAALSCACARDDGESAPAQTRIAAAAQAGQPTLPKIAPFGPVDPSDVAAPHAQPQAVFPTTADGLPLMQLGAGGFSYINVEEPLIILSRSNSPQINAWGPDGARMEHAELWEKGFIDPETMLPKAVPADMNGYRLGFVRFGARFKPDWYAGTYVVEWEGDGFATLTFANRCETVADTPQGGRVECEFAPDKTSWGWITVTEASDGFRNLRVYRKADEAEVKAGRVLSPAFRAQLSGYKILRALDMQAINATRQRRVDQYLSETAWSYGASGADKDYAPDAPFAVPPRVLFDIAIDADVALWMHLPAYVGAPDSFDAAFPNVNTVRFEVAEPNAAAIIESGEWEAFADRVVADMIAAGYPQDRRFYLELSNEHWNNAGGFVRGKAYFWGLGDGLEVATGRNATGEGGWNYSHGYGYAAARMVHAMERAFARAGRAQAWTPVIATQNFNHFTTKWALEGYRAYFEDRGMDPAPWLAMAGVSTASYYSGGSENGRFFSAPDNDAHRQMWLDAIAQKGADALARELSDWVIGGGPDGNAPGSIPRVIHQRALNRNEAEKAGAFFLGDYEGGDHDMGPKYLRSEPAFADFMRAWRWGPEGERVTRAWIEAMRADDPDGVIANFAGAQFVFSGSTLANPWADGHYSEDTGRKRALEEFLRR